MGYGFRLNYILEIVIRRIKLLSHLSHYREVTNEEKNNSAFLERMNISGSSFNSFWNSYKLDDMSNLLKTSLYQLSPSAPPSKQTMKEHESGPYNPIDADVSSEVLKKVSSVQLSNYVANLRMVRSY